MTGPDQGREEEAKRKSSRRVPPNELHASEDETYHRLLEELETTDRKYARLLDELSVLDDNRRSRGQRAILGQGVSVPPSDAVTIRVVPSRRRVAGGPARSRPSSSRFSPFRISCSSPSPPS